MAVPDEQTPFEDLLRRRPWEGAAEGELCGDPELLAAYAEGQLPPKARERLEQHLAACAACQAAVVRLVRLAPQESAAAAAAAGTQTARAPRTPLVFRWRWALPTLAGVILVGSFIYYERFQIVAPRPSTAPAHVAEQVAPALESPTGPEAPQAPSEAATHRGGPRREADKARPVGGATAAVASEEERWRQQPQQEPKGNFAANEPATAAPVPAAPPPPSPSGADRLAHLESSAERALKTKDGPQVLDDAVAQSASKAQAKSSVTNKLADRRRAQPAPKPSRSKELRRMQAEPKNTAKSVLTFEGRLTERADVAEEKETKRAGVGGRRQQSEEAAGVVTGLKAQDAKARGPFRKQIRGATHRLALTASGLLLVAPAESNEWQPLTIPWGGGGHRFRRFRRSFVGAVARRPGCALCQPGPKLASTGRDGSGRCCRGLLHQRASRGNSDPFRTPPAHQRRRPDLEAGAAIEGVMVPAGAATALAEGGFRRQIATGTLRECFWSGRATSRLLTCFGRGRFWHRLKLEPACFIEAHIAPRVFRVVNKNAEPIPGGGFGQQALLILDGLQRE